MISYTNYWEMSSEDPQKPLLDHQYPQRKSAFLYFGIISLVFSLLFFIFIFLAWFLPVDLEKLQPVLEFADYFDNVQQPINSFLDEVQNITLTLDRINFHCQTFSNDINTTIYQIDNSFTIDGEAFWLLSKAIDGLVDSLEGINNSILGFIIDDNIMNSARKIAEILRLLDPDIKQMQKSIIGIASDLKAFTGGLDWMDNNLTEAVKIAMKVKSLVQIFIDMTHIVHDRIVHILSFWSFVQFGSTGIAIPLCILSLLISIWFYKQYIHKHLI